MPTINNENPIHIRKDILALPIAKVFAMTDANDKPFVISFHYRKTPYGNDIYFIITPNRKNVSTKVPVLTGLVHSINSFMEMLAAYDCKYISRLHISEGEVLSKDYLDGLADGTIITYPKSEGQLTKSKKRTKEEIINDFLELFNEDYDTDWTDFCITQGIITP